LNVPQQLRAEVLGRDNHQCQGCGTFIFNRWYSIQHRIARGVGGGNTLANLVTLCGSATSAGCHRTCEDRDDEMHRRGLWLGSWENALDVPIHTWDGRIIYLSNEESWLGDQ
jgi:5-methylcytosine-specific restriction endonuclease McrA